MSKTTTYVAALPLCQPCEQAGSEMVATYDAKTVMGPWAYLCDDCFADMGVGLGTGRGQQLILGEEPERTDADIRREVREAIEAGDFDAFEDAVGDRDPIEFL